MVGFHLGAGLAGVCAADGGAANQLAVFASLDPPSCVGGGNYFFGSGSPKFRALLLLKSLDLFAYFSNKRKCCFI